jgi:hypothetical protein
MVETSFFFVKIEQDEKKEVVAFKSLHDEIFNKTKNIINMNITHTYT